MLTNLTVNQAELVQMKLDRSDETIGSFSRRVGITDAVLRNLLKGRTKSLKKLNWRPLAEALDVDLDVVVAAARGEADDPWAGEQNLGELTPFQTTVPFVHVPRRW